MNYITRGLAASAIAMSATEVMAGGYAELYYSASELEISFEGESASEDFDGFGLRGGFDLTPNVLVRAEYSSEEADVDDFELEIIRLGFGYQAPVGPATAFYLGPDYIRFEAGDGSGETDDGFGGFLGLRHAFAPSVAGSVEVGYISVEFEEGPYAEATFTGLVTDTVGVFGRYRVYALEDKEFSDIEIDFSGFQVGVRIGF